MRNGVWLPRADFWRTICALCGLAIAISLGASAPACAEEAAPPCFVENAQIGLQGVYKAGCWTTLQLTIRSSKTIPGDKITGRVRSVSVDGDNVPVIYDDPQGDFTLSADEGCDRILSFQAGGLAARTTVEFELSDGRRWQQPLKVPAPIPATREMVLSLGKPIDVDQVTKYIRNREEFSFAPISIPVAADVPRDGRCYQNVSIIVLPLGRDSLYDSLDEAQRSTLLEWVRRGGRLIVSSAVRGKELFGPDGPLAELAPAPVRGVVRMKRTIGIETAGGAAVDVDTIAAGKAPYVLDFEKLPSHVDLWEVQAGEGGQPLVSRLAYGFGQVQVIGLDLDQSPWAEWPGRARFLAELLQDQRSRMESQEEGNIRGEVTHLGYEDLTGQLRTALEQFSHVTFLNFTLVAVIAGIYLILIGPVDYFLIRRSGFPRHYTWGTLLLLVAGTAIVAWNIADRSHGHQVWINQTELIDVQATTGRMRGVSWVHVYSPESLTYNATWQSTPQALGSTQEAIFSWQGLAGKGLGGLGMRASNFQPTVRYQVETGGKAGKIQGMPIPFAGSKSLRAEWTGQLKLPETSSLQADANGQLRGELANPFPFELIDCRVIYHDHIYAFKKPIPAGDAIPLLDVSPANLPARLTERVVRDQQDRATAWDTSRIDIPRIMEMIMFHEAANGSGYTNLAHGYQGNLDFSQQIDLQQAVLVGRTNIRQSEVQLESRTRTDSTNYDQSWTWFRVLLPVQPYVSN